jgi:hypothetical protein
MVPAALKACQLNDFFAPGNTSSDSLSSVAHAGSGQVSPAQMKNATPRIVPADGEMDKHRPGKGPPVAGSVTDTGGSGVLTIAGRHGRIAIAAVVLLLAAVSGAAGSLDLESDREAANAGLAGEVSGRVYEERRRLDLPERPLQDVTITLLPRPEALARRLESIKHGARDSHDAFRTAVSRMLEAQQEHERAVRAAGTPDLVFRAAVGPDGTFTLPGVPTGAWLLVGRQHTLVPKAGPQVSRTDREMYRAGPPLQAYESVRLWVREIAVTGRPVETVALTDRNVWFSGVIEVRPGAGRP